MSATYVEKQIPDLATTLKTSVGLRVAIGLIPAALLIGAWGDFARSVTIGDAVTPMIEAAASTAAALPEQSRESVVGDLSSMLSARKDLSGVHVVATTNPDRSLTIRVTASSPSVFVPFLVRSFDFERSTTAPIEVNF